MKKKMEKRGEYLFDNRSLAVLIFPLVVEQLLAVLVGMADSIMVASVGEAAVSGVSLVDQIMVLLINACLQHWLREEQSIAGQYPGTGQIGKNAVISRQRRWYGLSRSCRNRHYSALLYLGKSFILHTGIWKNRRRM